MNVILLYSNHWQIWGTHGAILRFVFLLSPSWGRPREWSKRVGDYCV